MAEPHINSMTLAEVKAKAPSTNELRGFNARLTALLNTLDENVASDLPERRLIVETQGNLARLIDMLEH